MPIGEVCLYTQDVIGLANFYRTLLKVEGQGEDDVHQFILSEGTALTLYNDGSAREENGRKISLAFTVADVDAEYLRLQSLGVEIVDGPTIRPWGAKNMSCLEPEGNLLCFRSFPGEG